MPKEIKDIIKNIKPQIIKNESPRIDLTLCIKDCPYCHGVGWLRQDVPIHHPDFGQVFPCPNIPLERSYIQGSYGLMISEQRQLNWSKFLNLNNIQVVIAQIREFLTRGWGWCYIYGDYGTAKTMLLKTAIAETIRVGHVANYVTMVNLLDNLRDAFDTNDPRESALRRIDVWIKTSVLAIDEFDKARQTDWSKERIFKLMNDRYESGIRHETMTIIGSNIPPDKFDGYLASRINDGRNLVIEIIGEDSRPFMTEDDLF